MIARNLEPRVSPALCQRLVAGMSRRPTADKEPEKLWARDWIAREKKSGRVRLSTNALKINMENVPSIVVIENLSLSSSVNRLLLLFLLALVNLDLLWRES